ncbi:hypothetical protein [Mesorhizobium sp.]|uniref:hypothetical protein n=1 Tax=Mesorhizobium sp. TaxID=1871066 RepID=UPI0025F416B3|nr:hypothetical protein [Mesorhizobium sp.]
MTNIAPAASGWKPSLIFLGFGAIAAAVASTPFILALPGHVHRLGCPLHACLRSRRSWNSPRWLNAKGAGR